MKEHPTLFSAPMVRAILEGRKTQTRRVVKPAAWQLLDKIRDYNGKPGWQCLDFDVKCPYGTVGDRLWVRETWFADPPCDGSWADTQWSGCGRTISEIPKRFHKQCHCIYRATWTGIELVWTPSIFMPRWASRITLETTDIRVERIQEITEEDIKAEGFQGLTKIGFRYAFGQGWNSINEKRGFGWSVNPWVWAISFKRIK